MLRFRKTYALLILFTAIVATTALAATQNLSLASKDTALIQDAEAYAYDLGVDIDTALHRLMLQDVVGELSGELAVKEADTYAGLWIQHTPEFRIIARFTHSGKETIRPYIENGLLEYLVDIRTADVSLAELEATQVKILQKINNIKIPFDLVFAQISALSIF